MPFGMYKGVKIGGLPSHYLLWLGDQPWLAKFPELQEYIEDNRGVLEKCPSARKYGWGE